MTNINIIIQLDMSVFGYSWDKFKPIILYNLTFDVFQIVNPTHLFFLDSSRLDISS